MRQNWKYLLLFIFTNVVVFYITPIMFTTHNSSTLFFYYLLRASLLIATIFLIPYVFKKYIKNTTPNTKHRSVSVLIVFLLFFYIAELFFTFYPESNGKNDTYCSNTWFYYYWKVNKLGFRDIEFDQMYYNGKFSIVFAGDSYTVGHGIKNPDDRVSNRIRHKYPDYNIYNIGRNGMDINDEWNLIKNMPIQPDILVLQICDNDWDYLIDSLPKKSTTSYLSYAAVNGFSISKYSFLLNYLHSKVGNIFENLVSFKLTDKMQLDIYKDFNVSPPKLSINKDAISILTYCKTTTKLPEDSIQNILFKMFKEFNPSLKVMTDTALFNNYLDKLATIQAFCTNQKIHFIVVPYPAMTSFSINVTGKYMNKYLCSKIKARGIECLDVFPSLYNAHLKTYRVNSSDNHINPAASKIIADTLAIYLRQ